VKIICVNKNIKDLKLIFNVVEKWDNIVIVILKHYFLSFCIIIFQKKLKKKETKKQIIKENW